MGYLRDTRIYKCIIGDTMEYWGTLGILGDDRGY